MQKMRKSVHKVVQITENVFVFHRTHSRINLFLEVTQHSDVSVSQSAFYARSVYQSVNNTYVRTLFY